MEQTEPRAPAELAAIADKLCRFAPGDVICREGEPCEYAYLVRTGEVELRILGRPRRLRRGALFGEQVMLPATSSVGTAIATRGSELVRLKAAELEDILRDRPDIAAGLFRALATRVALPLHHPPAEAETTRSVVAQIVIRLDTSLDPARTSTTLRELAAAAGVDLPTAHRSLSVLFDQKLLYLAEDDLVAPDVAALEALLD